MLYYCLRNNKWLGESHNGLVYNGMSEIDLIKIKCYHTCSNKGTEESILAEAPFLSKENGQWLSQGYYFWSDNDHYAKAWGVQSYSGKYAVISCELFLNQYRLLDLVGNVDDCIYFDQLSSIFSEKLAQAAKQKTPEPTVSAIIEFFRRQAIASNNDSIFPYDAIKAKDIKIGRKIRYTKSRPEAMELLPRIQICLFEHAKKAIKNKELHMYVA